VQSGKIPNGILDGGNIVEVEGVDAMLAKLLGAIGTTEAGIAFAAHGRQLVPELVDVAVIGSGELLGSLADTVAGARVGARGALARNTFIAIKALALTGGSVAITLVGALHVVVGRVTDTVEV